MFQSDIKVQVVNYPDRKNFTMRYTDPISGKQVARSTGTTKRREADRAASVWEKELREGKYHRPDRISWEEFRERYEDEKLSALSNNMFEASSSAVNHLERILNPKLLATVSAATLSKFQAELRQEGMKGTTIATHLRHLQAAFSWAVSMGMLPKVPHIVIPRRSRGQSLMRGRPVTDKEFEQMLEATREVRPKNWPCWQHYLEGLWLSGLRLEESTVLAFDEEAPISVDYSGRHTRLRIYAEAEKGRQDRLLPIAPEFANFLSHTPVDQRSGKVFQLNSLNTQHPLVPKSICKIVSSIGQAAGIVVNKAEGKYASAHDLRRSFGTRWASRVKPATLQLLMRHKSIETTLKYYVGQDADDVADQLWEGYEGSNGSRN